jgi:hypothetical protein
MYVCHECGRDNSNNMKNGGWLDSYADGGSMQEHQENYNDNSVSLPEGYVGEGYDTSGRNYSPAWGGQFEDGGLIPIAQNGRATRADSLAVFNNAVALNKHYDNLRKKGFYKNPEKRDLSFLKNPYQTDPLEKNLDLEKLKKETLKYYRDAFKEAPETRGDWEDFKRTYPNKTEEDYKKGLAKSLKETKSGNKNKYYYKDIYPSQIDPLAPSTLIDTRIVPQYILDYKAKNNSKPPAGGSITGMYGYDPLAVKPFNMLTDAEKKLRVEKYGTDGVPKSYLPKKSIKKEIDKPIKVKPVEVKPQLQPMVEAINLPPMQNQDPSFPKQELDLIRPIQAPKSYNVNTQRYNMQGPSDYYQANEEGVDYETALKAKQAADAYNKSIEKKYGNPEALKNPKAVERLKQLRQDVQLTPQYQMGGSIPGAVGFSYARTNNPAPSNGPYAKKTMASAKSGKVIKDDRGQWAHPGEITEIDSPYITMQGVPYPVLGISDEGDTQMMYPEEEYKFKGKKVTEFPMAKNGLRQEQKGLVNLDQLTNFTNYNTKQPGGWMDKYQ